MYTHADKTQENKTKLVANQVANKNSGATSTVQFVDNRPLAIQMRKIQGMVNNSPQGKQAAQLIADKYSSQQQPIQRKENKTGLPDNLKSGVENLSGYSMDDVKVHYNSDKPSQLQAHAYTQGTNIHIGPGQEKHLSHEAWHVVQQKQGRVKPTMQAKGVAINDDRALEREADLMGVKAFSVKRTDPNSSENKVRAVANSVAQKKSSGKKDFGFLDNRREGIAQRKLQEMANNSSEAIQRKVDVIVQESSTLKKKMIVALGDVEDFKDGTDAGDEGWLGVEKYRARYKVKSKDGKYENTNKVGPLQNKFTEPNRGHVLARTNGGDGNDPENIFAQDGGTNNRTYKSFEADMSNILNEYDDDDEVEFVCYLEGQKIYQGDVADAAESSASEISSMDMDSD